MDRVLLSYKDMDMLVDWFRAHGELVRKYPCPLKAVEIGFTFSDQKTRVIRNGNLVKITIFLGGKLIAKMEFELDAKRQKAIQRKSKTKLSETDQVAALACYCSLMAYMAYEKPELVERDEPSAEPRKKHERRDKGAKKSVTYILRSRKKSPQQALGGHHASPKGIFTVRGHYRQYKSGKRIWIAEYKKGTGEKKSKTYKMGVKNDGLPS